MTRYQLFVLPAGLLLLGLAAYSAFLVEHHFKLTAGTDGRSIEDVLGRTLGSAKEVVGDLLFLKADSYFHGGVERVFEESQESHQKEGIVEDDSEVHSGHKDWIARINAQVRSHKHYHLSKAEQQEMLPFFRVATVLDPHHIEAILTTAYWLDTQLGKTDEAIEVLKTGMQNNPTVWQIPSDLGDIYLKKKEDPVLAEQCYSHALTLLISQKHDPHEALHLHYFLAESQARSGKTAEALLNYEKALGSIDPDKPLAIKDTIRGKIAMLGGSDETL